MMEPQLVVDQRGDCSVGRPHYMLEVEVLELEEACGVLLQERCPTLQQRVVSGIPSCAEKAPWNVILELRKRRRRRDVSVKGFLG